MRWPASDECTYWRSKGRSAVRSAATAIPLLSSNSALPPEFDAGKPASRRSRATIRNRSKARAALTETARPDARSATTDASAFAHLEQQRVLFARSGSRSSTGNGSGNLGRVEDGLQDILRVSNVSMPTLSRFADTSAM